MRGGFFSFNCFVADCITCSSKEGLQLRATRPIAAGQVASISYLGVELTQGTNIRKQVRVFFSSFLLSHLFTSFIPFYSPHLSFFLTKGLMGDKGVRMQVFPLQCAWSVPMLPMSQEMRRSRSKNQSTTTHPCWQQPRIQGKEYLEMQQVQWNVWWSFTSTRIGGEMVFSDQGTRGCTHFSWATCTETRTNSKDTRGDGEMFLFWLEIMF